MRKYSSTEKESLKENTAKDCLAELKVKKVEVELPNSKSDSYKPSPGHIGSAGCKSEE